MSENTSKQYSPEQVSELIEGMRKIQEELAARLGKPKKEAKDKETIKRDYVAETAQQLISFTSQLRITYMFKNGHSYPAPVNSPPANALIRKIYRELTGKSPSVRIIREVGELLVDEASKSDEIPVEPRFFYDRKNNTGYLDLNNNKGTCVILRPGKPEIGKLPTHFAFHRPSTTRTIPDPVFSKVGKPVNTSAIMDLLNFFKTENERKILMVYFTYLFSPIKERLILYLYGESQFGKSGLTKIIAHLFDPRTRELVNEELTFPRHTRDIMAMLVNRFIIAFGNESEIDKSISNEFSKRVTGGSSAEVQLYSQLVSMDIEGIRALIINTLGLEANRTDLIGRCLAFEMNPISDEHWLAPLVAEEKFHRLRNEVLGAICGAVCVGLENWDPYETKRMGRYSEFVQWGESVAPAFGWTEGEFRKIMKEHIVGVAYKSAENNDVVQMLIELIRKVPPGKHIECTWIELVGAIEDVIPGYRHTGRLSPEKLSRDVKDATPLLKLVGIKYDRPEKSINGYHIIRLELDEESTIKPMPLPRDEMSIVPLSRLNKLMKDNPSK